MASCSCSSEAVAASCSGVGAELGPGPRPEATDRGAGKEALSGDGREAFRAAGGFTLSVLVGLLFTQESEPLGAARRATDTKQEGDCYSMWLFPTFYMVVNIIMEQ